MSRADQARLAGEGSRQSPRRQAVAVYQIRNDVSHFGLKILENSLGRTPISRLIADVKRNDGNSNRLQRAHHGPPRRCERDELEIRADELRQDGLDRPFASVDRRELEDQQDPRDGRTPLGTRFAGLNNARGRSPGASSRELSRTAGLRRPSSGDHCRARGTASLRRSAF